jgi:hypothetical protein
MRGSLERFWFALALCALLGAPLRASATDEERFIDRLGGHFGVAVPIVTFADGDATTIDEFTMIAFPMGVSVKNALGPLAFDLEVVPSVAEGHDVDATIHPGFIYGGRYGAVGLRAAFEIDNNAFGFTPLIARPFRIGESLNLFLELDVPVRFPAGSVGTVVGVATHLGIAF